jgi:toxin ParE1/3/4
MEIVWFDAAIDTLNEHVAYVAGVHQGAARRIRMRIFERVEQLLDMPHIGRPGRIGGLRELPIPPTPYVVAYRIRQDTIEILRVLHGAQDWPAQLED